jgi:hypothetical protein
VLGDAARILNCTGVVKSALFKVLKKTLKNPFEADQLANLVEESVDQLVEILEFPSNAQELANLLCPSLGQGESIGGFVGFLAKCTSVGSPLDGFARLDSAR